MARNIKCKRTKSSILLKFPGEHFSQISFFSLLNSSMGWIQTPNLFYCHFISLCLWYSHEPLCRSFSSSPATKTHQQHPHSVCFQTITLCLGSFCSPAHLTSNPPSIRQHPNTSILQSLSSPIHLSLFSEHSTIQARS